MEQKKSMSFFNPSQFLWGVVAGTVTVIFMGIAYKYGFDKGKESVEGNILATTDEVVAREIYIDIKTDCGDEFSEISVESGTVTRRYCVETTGESTLEVLKQLEEQEEAFSFEYDESDFGAFITGINGLKPDVALEFWGFYVNEEMSMVGISDYVVGEGNELLFRVEEVEW